MSVVLTEEQKQEERVKAQQAAEFMNIPYVDPFPASDEPPADEPAPVELSNEQLLELLNKRTGGGISSLDDLKPKPTPEEIAAKQQERESAMLTYGLTTGKFKKEDYDAYQLAISNKKDLVRGDLTAQLTEANPEMAPEAIQEMVANYFFENLDETHPLRVAREKEIATLSDLQIKKKYENIVNLPNDYAKHEEGLNTQSNFERKVEATLPVYTADVNRALQSLQHFSVQIPDTKNPSNNVTVELDYADNDLKEVADTLLSSEQVKKAVAEGRTSFEQIKEIADYVLWKKHGPRLISQAAKKYNATQKEGYLNGRKGLNAGSDALEVHDDNNQRTDLDAVYDEMLASETKR